MDGDYVTLNQVREEAGFTGNINISDDIIEGYLLAAESEVKAYIGRRYQLPLDPIPVLVSEITKQLAAGFLLLKEYGAEEEGTTKDGQLKIEWARKRLEMIMRGQITLFDSEDQELPRSRSVGAEGWPNNTTETKSFFTVDQRF